jgi:DNA mismatch endonuclease (patch repair protein)
MPRTRVDFWTRKIERNKARDLEDRNALKLLGWNVIIIWECQLNQAEIREQTLQSLVRTLSQIELNIAKSKRPAVKRYDFENEKPYSLVADDNDNTSSYIK